MNITIQNIEENKKLLLEDISTLFHDMRIVNIIITSDKINVIIKRPGYERAKDQKLLKFFSIYRIPSLETVICITGLKSIKKEEENETKYDWFLSFDVDGKRKNLIMRGVLNTYFLEYSDKTEINIEDKENGSDYSLSFRKRKERNEKVMIDLRRKILQKK